MEEVLEGLLYIQGDEGLTISEIESILGISELEAKETIFKLKKYYDDNKRGLRINFLGNTIKLTTREDYKDYYMKLVDDTSSNTLSQSSLETLAIIAYNEPITRGDVDSYRGVDSSYIIRKLLAKGLIKEAGKSNLPGKPTLYKTTNDFLDYFGLSSIEDLPLIEDIKVDNREKELYTSIYKEG